MSKYKYLATNTLVFFISKFSSKILVFLLLPLYTSVLSTSEYGISDLMNTSVSLFYIILTLMVAESVLRFSFDKNYEKAQIFSTGLFFILVSSILMGLGIIIANKINKIKIFDGYWLHYFLLYVFYSLDNLLANFIRGLEKIKLIALAGVVGTIVTVISNIFLLVVFKYGIYGYLTSMILSHVVVSVAYLVFGRAYRYIDFKIINKNLIIEMIKYSTPIVVVQISWWINSAIDRYIVALLLGTSETGLLSLAHKIPSMLTVFTSVFMQAWKLSAIKEYESESSRQFYSKILNLYNSVLIIAGAFIIAFIKPISSLIFKSEFSSAWYLAPVFILAFVINGISAFLGTFFIANKNTKSLAYSTLIGAGVNIILNFVLIKRVGTFGAGISTAISYFIISIIRIVQVEKKMHLNLEYARIITSYILLVVLIKYVLNTNIIIIGFILSLLLMINKKHILDFLGKAILHFFK